MRQLFTIAGVDTIGKHTFIKGFGSPNGLQPVYGSPEDAIYIGTENDTGRFIQQCRTELASNGPVNYIPYLVKSDLTTFDLYDQSNQKVVTYTKH
jgi:hypothetical protein